MLFQVVIQNVDSKFLYVSLYFMIVINVCVCTLISLQLCREFRTIAEIDGRATSVMSSWPDWVERLVKFGKEEAGTRPMIRKLLLEYETGGSMDNPTGLWHA